jgi:phenylacetate-CoA ligase
LESNEKLSNKDLQILIDDNIFRSLTVATDKIPFYKRFKNLVKSNKNNIRNVLIEEIPIVTKEQIIEEKESFYPKGMLDRILSIKDTTGGTTGAPLEVVRSLKSINYENAFNYRHWGWFGYKQGMKRATLRGDEIYKSDEAKPPYSFYNRFDNQLFLSTMHLTDKTVKYFVDELEKFKPYMLEAYPSSAYDLAVYMSEQGLHLSIPYIFTGSEPLYPYQKELIEEMFNTRVVDAYGMSERIGFATECESGSLHVNSDYSFMEIVDEEGKSSEKGNVVGTTFYNSILPLIRYKMTDTLSWSNEECECGRHFPVIKAIDGRTEDKVIGSKGNDIGPFLYKVLKGVNNIRKCQIALVDKNSIEVRIVPGPNYLKEEEEKIISNFKKDIDKDMHIEIKIKEEIGKTGRLKYRWIVNEYAHGLRETLNR